MTTLPEPDSSPARRPESLLDVSVPHRAGAIVSEFISSIVGEAESRAAQIVIEAEDEAGPRRQAALDAASRVREYNDALAELLAELRSDLRRESDLLYADPRVRQYVREPQRLPAPQAQQPAPERTTAPADEVVDAVEVEDEAERYPAAPEEYVPAPEETTAVLDAETDSSPAPDEPADAILAEEEEEAVEGVLEEEPAEETAEPAEVEAEPVPHHGGTPVVAADTTERDSKFARMTDEELARAHANAVKVAERDPYGEQADSMRRLADAALEEALRRPAFAIAHPAKVRGRRRSPLARRKRAQEEALAELREACQRARLAP